MLLSSNIITAQTTWNLTGNATNPGEFLGTTNDNTLFLKAGNGVMNLSTNGNLRFGFYDVDYHKISLYQKHNNKINIQWANSLSGYEEYDGLIVGLQANSMNAIINQQENANLSIYTNNTERLTILNTGYIGVGTTNPQSIFHVNGSLTIADGSQAINKILISDANGKASWQNLTLTLNSNQLSIFGSNSINLSGYLDNTDNQNLSLSGNTLSLTNDATTVDLSQYLDNTDTHLTEIEVDNYVSNNGYLTSFTEVDGSITNEIQDLQLTGNTLSLTNDATTVDLSQYLDNTDTHLTESEVDNYVANNGYLTLFTEVDGSITNEIQDLQLTGNNLSITNNSLATTIDLSVLQDGFEANTDNQNLSISNNQLSISNGNTIDLGTLNHWNKNSNNQLFYNTANVGIGTEEPSSNLHIHSSQSGGTSGGSLGRISTRGMGDSGASTLLLTNNNTGKTSSDGLLIESSNLNGKIQIQETGNLLLFAKNNKGIVIDNEGRIQLNKFQVVSSQPRMLVVDRYGFISTENTNAYNDNMGNHTATLDLNMNGKNIIGGSTTENTSNTLAIFQNNNTRNSAYIEMYGTNHSTTNNRGAMSFVTNGTTGDFSFTNYVSSWSRLMTLKANGTLQINNLAGTNKRVLIADNTGNVLANNEITLNANNKLNINSLQGTGERIVTADSEGNILATTELSSLQPDNMGNCGATRNIEMNGKSIYNNNNDLLTIGNSDNTSGISMYGDSYEPDWKKGSISIFSKGDIRFTNSSNWTALMTIKADGRVKIGDENSTNEDYILDVRGKAHFCEAVVKRSGWCDYVLKDDYKLMGLKELEEYIKQNSHLPEIPTEADVIENGIELGEMNALLLKKVEELTLYIIEQENKINTFEESINQLAKKIKNLENH